MARRGWRMRSALWRYGFAVLAVGVAAMLMAGARRLGLEHPVAPFLAAILLTGWYAGVGPVVLATVLSTVSFNLFLPPPYHLAFDRAPAWWVVWFLAFAWVTGWFSAAWRRDAEALEGARQELERRVAARSAELQHSETYLIAAQRLTHTGTWARRIATGEMEWSEECFRIFGLDPKTTRPNRQVLARLWHPDDRDIAEYTIDAGVRDQRGYEMDVRIVRPDGSIRYVHSLGQPVLDAAGDVAQFMGVIQDVTDRQRAERALRRARVRALRARFAATLEERTRLAREIHDTVLQGFTGVALKLVAVTGRVDGQPETVTALHDVIKLAQRTLEDARRAIWDMRSPALGGADFATALRAAAEDGIRGSGLALEYVVKGSIRPVDPDVEALIFRVAQEAIANAVRHAAARTVRLTLRYEARRVCLSVADDGRGFAVDPDSRAYEGHWGLLGMRERASRMRAGFAVRSTPGHGTEIVLRIPSESRAKPGPLASKP